MMPIDDQAGPDNMPAISLVSRSFAWRMFAVLFAMNLIDYVDRYVLNAVLSDIQKSFLMSDTQAGVLASYFLISYSAFSPFMGWAGDRFRRTWLLAIGVGIWSLATVGTAFADTAGQVALARALLGIGEAAHRALDRLGGAVAQAPFHARAEQQDLRAGRGGAHQAPEVLEAVNFLSVHADQAISGFQSRRLSRASGNHIENKEFRLVQFGEREEVINIFYITEPGIKAAKEIGRAHV